MTALRTLLARLDAWVAGLPSARRAAAVATLLVALALALGMAWWTGRRPAAALVRAAAAVAPSASAGGLASDATEPAARAGRPGEIGAGLAAPVDAGPIAYQRAIERATEQRIESLLATVVGVGKVVARVAATIDFARTERTEETYDPDKTALRETRSTREQGPGGGKGTPGAGSAGGEPPARTERRDEAQSYEVSKVVSRTVAPVGVVKSLSVAVLVDGTYRDEGGARTFVPRSDDEIDRLKTLVASAAGLSEARGDRLQITSAPFQTPADGAPSLVERVVGSTPAMAGPLLALVLALGVATILVRVVAPAARPMPVAGGAVDAASAGEGDPAVATLARENVALAQQHPERVAQLVRQWLLEEAKTSA